ncbi:MAG: DUF924 domain-containing protein [Candidatus Omnitrophica bacterium]|nr:DUF924 domain-containing protein [Candidatus Omnitrophota bacterium]MCB9747460.1 DUF924 domain-containing protein [Candidatus Omnitrophota bacterium]
MIIERILNFWFEGIDDQTAIDKRKSPFNKWFRRQIQFDDEIRRCFEQDYLQAKNGQYKSLEEDSRGKLALILLFDQFTRNIYRNRVQMYEADSFALDLSMRTIQSGGDAKLYLIERVFLYMPLMHSETLAMQDLSVKCFENLVYESKRINPGNSFYYQSHLNHAQKCQDVIKKFSRFPQRNQLLNRDSSIEELEFLRK